MRKLACARYLQALADDTRIRITRMLLDRPKCVTDIATALRCNIGHTSYHLGILRNAGVVDEDRQGQFVYYSLSDEVRGAVSEDQESLEFGCITLRFADSAAG